MKKLLSILLCVAMIIVMVPGMAFAEEANTVAKIGDTEYQTLADAIAAVPKDGTETTILLVDDAIGGVKVSENQNIIINLNGYTFDVKMGVGSVGTETNGMQLLHGATVTLQNGAIKSTTSLAYMLKNYANLTVENISFVRENIWNAVIENTGVAIVKEGTTFIGTGATYDISTGNYPYSPDEVITNIQGGNIGKVAIESESWGKQDNQKVSTNITGGKVEKLEIWGPVTGDSANLKWESEISGGEVGSVMDIIPDNGSTFSVSGGSFGSPVNSEFLAEGLTVELCSPSKDAPYSYFPTVEEATEAAEPGDTFKDLNVEATTTPDTVTLNYNDGATANSSVGVAAGVTYVLPNAVRNGYTFQGWFDNAGNKITKYNASEDGGVEVTLTARWSVNATIGGGVYVPPTDKAVDSVNNAIKAIGDVTLDDADAIAAAREAYDKLTPAQQAKVKGYEELVAAEAKIEELKAEAAKAELVAAIKDSELVARTAMSKAKGKDAVKVYWFDESGKEVKFDGVEIYRSTQRYKGYGNKPFFTTTKDAYYNTAITEGTKYFYKVRAYKVVDGEKVYTEYSTKAWRTVK